MRGSFGSRASSKRRARHSPIVNSKTAHCAACLRQSTAVRCAHDPAKTRLQHIVILATTLRVRLEFGRVAVVREPD